jgi:hypothetical protein
MAELYRVVGPGKAEIISVDLQPRPNLYQEFVIGFGNNDIKNNITIVLTEEEAMIVLVDFRNKLKDKLKHW